MSRAHGGEEGHNSRAFAKRYKESQKKAKLAKKARRKNRSKR